MSTRMDVMADRETAAEGQTELAAEQAGRRLPLLRPVTLAGVSLVLAFAAQRSLDQRQGAAVGTLLYGVAAMLFLLAMRGAALEVATDDTEAGDVPAPSRRYLAMSLGLALLGCLDFGDNRFRPLGLVLWLGGLFLALRHLSRLSPEANVRRGLSARWKEHGFWIPARWLILLAIVLLGAWFRLYRLDEIPADLGPDLIYHYYDTLDILDGHYAVHFPERESLLFYVTAAVARVVGFRPFTLFLTSALLGTVTIVALYALGAEIFGPPVGLLAALLLAVNRWHLALSRSAYPAVLTPLAAILLLYVLIRALRRRQYIDFAWCGLQLGLGLYTYTPYKAMPVFILIALALYGLARGRGALRHLGPRVLVLFAVAVVVAAPLIRFAIERPHEYFIREEVTFRLKREQANQDVGLPAYLWRTLLGLNYRGDLVARWNYPEARHMGFVSGALMVLGLAYALWRWRKGYNAILVSAWFVLLLPAALGMLPNDSASSLRMSGMLGPALLLAALPLALIERAVRPAPGRSDTPGQLPVAAEDSSVAGPRVFSLTIDSAARHYAYAWRPDRRKGRATTGLVLVLLAALLGLEARETNRFYFHDYVQVAPDRLNYSNAREIARVIEHYGDRTAVYIRSWEFWFDTRALWANLGLKEQGWEPWVQKLDPGEPPLSTISGPALFILNPADEEGLATLRAFFPRGVAIVHAYPDGIPAFYAFYAER